MPVLLEQLIIARIEQVGDSMTRQTVKMHLAHLSRICILRYDTTYFSDIYIPDHSLFIIIHTRHKLSKAGQDTTSDALHIPSDIRH